MDFLNHGRLLPLRLETLSMPKATSHFFVLSLFAAWCICLLAGFVWLSVDAANASPAAHAPQKITAQDVLAANNNAQLFVFYIRVVPAVLPH